MSTPRIIYPHGTRRRADRATIILLVLCAALALPVASAINRLAEKQAAAHAFEDCRKAGGSIKHCKGGK